MAKFDKELGKLLNQLENDLRSSSQRINESPHVDLEQPVVAGTSETSEE